MSRLHLYLPVGLMFSTVAAGCVQNPDESGTKEPTDGFPTYAVNEAAGAPSLPYQVCDSTSADLNNDGTLDFVAANHINPGFGYFMTLPGELLRFGQGQSVDFVAGGNSAGIIAVDLNADGKLDVANSDHEGIVTVRMNATPDGAGIDGVVFPEEGETNVGLSVDHGPEFGIAGVEGGLVSADFNGDGKPDIATSNLGTNALGDYSASVILGQTEPGATVSTFGEVQYILLPSAAISIDLGDFNNDGLPEFVTTNTEDGSISVMTNRTETGAEVVNFEQLNYTIPAGSNPYGAGPTNPVVADFNGDGWADIATANWNVMNVAVYINTTTTAGDTPSFADPVMIEGLDLNPLLVRAADLDGDGDNDIVVIPLAMNSGAAMAVIENETEGDNVSFAVVEVYPLPEVMRETFPYAWFTTAGNVSDFDGDGELDIAVAVARASFTLEAFELLPTDNVMGYIDPDIPVEVIDEFLPQDSQLVAYEKVVVPE
ncbi:MAG TPA: VCBS repeat-containing protein [Myxococcota bacterium]|nr:VCBS repeat-containing protein [Myxococcota bacterium]